VLLLMMIGNQNAASLNQLKGSCSDFARFLAWFQWMDKEFLAKLGYASIFGLNHLISYSEKMKIVTNKIQKQISLKDLKCVYSFVFLF